ncbi:Dihydrofolate reductase [Erysiphe neolycopersici]|uniref:Dihydrofolate reductase n=1 Tax=Erysiphe neolycopersici TaxID=212602 RepID=A0A420HDL3_9PEZI|nr:Dihydrofolate reductase [Erysiphe neolycopersici]
MSTTATAHELTLIVAATTLMGIGKAGTLPWAGLQKEMAYFARVTKKVPSAKTTSTLRQNVVIMGRKTWDSIPPRYRPLADRINIVITRNKLVAGESNVMGEDDEKIKYHQSRKNLIFVNSLESALEATTISKTIKPERIFVIGGAQIYEAALQMKEAKRILLTRILNDFDFDTKFPLTLNQDGTVQGDASYGWEKKSQKELSQWTGETNSTAGVQEENDIQYLYEMWERNEDK